MFQYLSVFRYIVYDFFFKKKATFNVRTCGRHSCSTERCGPSAFRFISCVFYCTLYFFFCFRLFLLFCMCLIVLFNFYLFIYLFNFYLFQSGSKISAQYRKKRINGIFPEELQLLQLTETKKTRGVGIICVISQKMHM